MNITLDANSQGDIRSCLGEETEGKNKGKTCYALLPVTDVASDGENYVSPKRIALNLLSLIVPQADHKVDEYFLRYVETHRRPRVSAPNITADQIAEIIKRGRTGDLKDNVTCRSKIAIAFRNATATDTVPVLRDFSARRSCLDALTKAS
uniref:Uncharacterized protein n=1 Tax=Vespula pensylvanica TaxID=30213 RepID=A0A834U7R8_VESPE|nr:hypothetical protein H0235_010545 [Vespula pensylvanica]